MENGAVIPTKRAKSYQKLRWKNYLNHLLNLWLFCGNISVDGRDYGENKSSAVNLPHKSNATIISEADFVSPHSNRSFGNANNSENHKSFNKTNQFSDFTRTSSHSTSHDDSSAAFAGLEFEASNKSSLSEKVFHLIKSDAERKALSENSINQSISSELSVQRYRHQKKVNTTRITNDGESSVAKLDFHRVKKSENGASEGENKLSIHYNQSSPTLEASEKNQVNKKVRKRLKSGRKIPTTDVEKKKSAKSDAKMLSKVSLLGLFEMTTHLGERWEGRSELAAAELAVKHVNERGLLPGYTLELITNDTQVTSNFQRGKIAKRCEREIVSRLHIFCYQFRCIKSLLFQQKNIIHVLFAFSRSFHVRRG